MPEWRTTVAHLRPQTGNVTVTGTVVCSGQAEFAILETRLVQQVGRFTLFGRGIADVTCDGVTRPWSVEVVSETGKFSGGKAADVTLGVACGEVFCGFDFEERRVQVRH